MSMFKCKFWLPIVLLMVLIGCENQDDINARKLYEAAQTYGDTYEYDKAIELLQRITIDYSDTEMAVRAESEIEDLERLQLLSLENKRNVISQKFTRIALALENYKLRYLSYPLTTVDLEKLPPELIPNFKDDWGNLIQYRAYAQPEGNPLEPDSYVLGYFGKSGLPGGTGLDQDHFYQDKREVNQLTFP